MGFDLVTWNPVVPGGSGWDVPGCQKLDGSFDTTHGFWGEVAGNTSGIPLAPGLATINTMLGFNQVVALYNWRANSFNQHFQNPFPYVLTSDGIHFAVSIALPLSQYIPQQTIPKAADYLALFNLIQQLLITEGWVGAQSLVLPSTPISRQGVRGVHLAYLRKILSCTGSIQLITANQYQRIGQLVPDTETTFPNTQYASGRGRVGLTNFCGSIGSMAQYVRVDSPLYGTQQSETDASQGSNGDIYFSIGRFCPDATHVKRSRLVFPFAIPEFCLLGPLSAQFTFKVQKQDLSLDPAFAAVCKGGFGFPMSMPGFFNGYQDFTTVAATGGVGLNTIVMKGNASAGGVGAFGGSIMDLILCDNIEFNSVNPTIVAGKNAFSQLTINDIANTYLTLTF